MDLIVTLLGSMMIVGPFNLFLSLEPRISLVSDLSSAHAIEG
jgi:hypothetical protein